MWAIELPKFVKPWIILALYKLWLLCWAVLWRPNCPCCCVRTKADEISFHRDRCHSLTESIATTKAQLSKGKNIDILLFHPIFRLWSCYGHKNGKREIFKEHVPFEFESIKHRLLFCVLSPPWFVSFPLPNVTRWRQAIPRASFFIYAIVSFPASERTNERTNERRKAHVQFTNPIFSLRVDDDEDLTLPSRVLLCLLPSFFFELDSRVTTEADLSILLPLNLPSSTQCLLSISESERARWLLQQRQRVGWLFMARSHCERQKKTFQPL